MSSPLTPQIIISDGNEVFHLGWDKLSNITTTIHGSNIVNSTGGVVIKGVKDGYTVTNTNRALFNL